MYVKYIHLPLVLLSYKILVENDRYNEAENVVINTYHHVIVLVTLYWLSHNIFDRTHRDFFCSFCQPENIKISIKEVAQIIFFLI